MARWVSVFRSVLGTFKLFDKYTFSMLIFSPSATEMTSSCSTNQIPAFWFGYLNQGFSTLALWTFGGKKNSLLCPIYSRIFTSIPHQLPVTPCPPCSICDNQKYLQILPNVSSGTKLPALRIIHLGQSSQAACSIINVFNFYSLIIIFW